MTVVSYNIYKLGRGVKHMYISQSADRKDGISLPYQEYE